MGQEVRYCTSAGGAKIAYTVNGQGRPLVFAMPFPGSIELDSDLPVVRNFFDGLLPGHMIVRFDQRGTGASQRDVHDISVEAQTGDLAAVVDALGLERFELFAGPGLPAHAAVTYCARTPDRVQHLILWEAAPAIRKVDGPVAEAERVLIRENWRGASRTLSDNIAPRAPVDIKKALTNIYRETLAADMVIRLWDEESDITAVLPHLAARCLVLHARDDRQVPLDSSRAIAAAVPGARLVAIDGDSAYFPLHHEQLVPIIREFLGDPPASDSAPSSAPGIRYATSADGGEEPRIQYVKTSDGVNIAYWTIGDGPPLLVTPPLTASHLAWEWRMPALRNWYRHLSNSRTVIRYDPRCMGLSDRNVMDVTQAASALDIGAVVKRLQVRELDVVAFAGPAIVALEFASPRPRLVRKFVIIDATARWSDNLPPDQLKALMSLLQQNWQLFRETYARTVMGWSAGPEAHAFAEFLEASLKPKDAARRIQAWSMYDATPCLSKIDAEALVIALSKHPIRRGSLDAAREIASAMPRSRLLDVPFEVPEFYASPKMCRAIDEFLGIAPDVDTASGKVVVPSGVHTILFTDLVGHTEMMHRLGDDAGRAVLREHERITREVLAAHGGVEVKTMGDGFMASFVSVAKAVECAVALQRAFAERNQSASEQLTVRVGLNAGEPIAEEGDLFGASVILASRVAAQAGAGEILVPDTVRGLLVGKGFSFVDRGVADLKGFPEPVRLYQVRWRDGEET